MFSDGFHAQICETHTCCGPWVWSYHPDEERACYIYARWAQNPYSFNVIIFELIIINYNWWLTAQKVILISQFNVILPRWFQSHLCWDAKFREDYSVGWSFSIYIYIYPFQLVWNYIGLTYFSCQSGMSIWYCGWNPKNHQLCADEFLLVTVGDVHSPVRLLGTHLECVLKQ